MDMRRIEFDRHEPATHEQQAIVPVAPDFATFIALTSASQDASATAWIATRLSARRTTTPVEDAIVAGCAGKPKARSSRSQRSFHLGVARVLTRRQAI